MKQHTMQQSRGARIFLFALAAVLGAGGCQSGADPGPEPGVGMPPGMIPDGTAPRPLPDPSPDPSPVPSPDDPLGPSRMVAHLEMPATVPAAGGALPIVVRFADAETGAPMGLMTTLHLAASAASAASAAAPAAGEDVTLGAAAELVVRRDVGTVTAWPAGDAPGALPASVTSFVVGIEEMPHVAPIEVEVVAEPDWRQMEGTLEDEALAWEPGSFIEVTDDVAVPEGETLTIGAGTRVRIADGANIDVEGDLEVAGTAEAPVVFEPAGTAWGGLRHRGEARYSHALLVGGGADASRAFGHSGSQPVIHAEPDARLTLDHVVIQDAPGKALGAEEATVDIADSVIARTDTGGELVASEVHIARAHFFDFPDRGVPLADDDNDALYLRDTLMRDGEPVTSTIEDSVFSHGQDDGLDHSGATVEIRQSWFGDFVNEGIACSEGGSVYVLDSVMTNNAQGLEVGHGAPAVTAEHVLIVDNAVGARYGDSYEDEYDGTLDITRSVIAFNGVHAVWNHLLGTGGPKDDAVRVTYSLVEGLARDQDLGEGTLLDVPLIGRDGLLMPTSAGIGAADDGSDLGLLTPQPTLVVLPRPAPLRRCPGPAPAVRCPSAWR